MTVLEAAKELEVTPESLLELLGKTNEEDELSDEEVANLFEVSDDEAPAQDASELPSEAVSDDGVVLFISEVRKHAFVCNGTMVNFAGHKLCAMKGGAAYNAIIDLGNADIRVVVDKPFENLRDRNMFRELLDSILFTGPQKEPSMDRGYGFVTALFHKDEEEELAIAVAEIGPSALIDLALERKSWIQTAEVRKV